MMIRTRFLFLSVVLSLLCIHLTEGLTTFHAEGDPGAQAELLASEMSNEELLGQLFLITYAGENPDADFLYWVRERKIGGVKIFGWNADNLDKLIQSITVLQSEAAKTPRGIPLFIATDQEGGWVRHVKGSTSVTPGNLAIGASGYASDAYESGYYIGQELRALGINMNFAPTVDIYTNHKADVIGPRAFSEDPVETGLLSVAYYRGMKKAGIICTAKHFPGHGAADKDSHGTLPLIRGNLDTLMERELVPYRFLIKEGLPAVMSGHLGFPDILGNETPASLSPFFLKTVLRERLGFQGLIITDDLRMSGAGSSEANMPRICKQAIEAGNDMIMISSDYEVYRRSWSYLIAEMARNEAFKKQVRESAVRILNAKLVYFNSKDHVPLIPDPDAVEREVPSKEGKEFFFQQACRSITAIKGNRIPIENPGKVLLVGQFNTFLKEGLKRFPGADQYFYPYVPTYYPRKEDRLFITEAAKKYDTIIFCLSNTASLEILKSLSVYKSKIVVFSVLTPIYLTETPWVDSAIAAYGIGEDSFKAGFAVLAGDFPPQGSLPVTLYEK